jgi:purine-binding chemotaxis protein CheW
MNSSALQRTSVSNQRSAVGMLQSDVGERFLGLIFQADVHALLPLGSLQGVVENQPQEILSVPQMPAYLLGIINWRGKSTWVADLTYLMGGSYLTPTPQSKILMLQSSTNTIGLLVDRTLSVVNYDATLALPLDEGLLRAPMLSLLNGYFLDDQHQMWVLIDLPQIFQMMNL